MIWWSSLSPATLVPIECWGWACVDMSARYGWERGWFESRGGGVASSCSGVREDRRDMEEKTDEGEKNS